MRNVLLQAESRRLHLRPLRPDDAEQLRRITDDPRITTAISFMKHPFTRADAEALIRMNESGSDCFLGLRQRSDGALVGVAGAHLRDAGDVEIGYWIGSAWHGQGYATEAVGALVSVLKNALAEHRIVAECRPENRASWRILEKLGFRARGADGARPGRRLLALPCAQLDA